MTKFLSVTVCTTLMLASLVHCGKVEPAESQRPTQENTSNGINISLLIDGIALTGLTQGLNILKKDKTISGAYRKGERTIFFTTHRGAMRQEFYKNAYPELGDREIDVLVLDHNGRVIYVQKGGDALDPAWKHAIEREAQLQPLAPLDRAEDMELLRECAFAIEKIDLPGELAAERRALIQTKLAIPDDQFAPVQRLSIKETDYAPLYGSDNWIAIHKEPIALGLGEHSATYSKKGSTIINACNHGRCALEMERKCQINGSPASEQYGDESCTTQYFWNSGWWFGPRHNCHDDTMRAVWGMRFGSQGSPDSGVCANDDIHITTPDCTTADW